MPTIRPIELQEWPLLQTIMRETYYDTFSAYSSEEDIQTYMNEAYAEEVLCQELVDANSEYYFLEEDGNIVAYLKLNTGAAQTEEIADNAMEIQRIYVRSQYKRKGYGQQLMAYSLERAKVRACSAIWLGVWENNKPALAFYRENGFKKVGEHVFMVGQQKDTDYIFLKKLDE